ncbi:MAG: tetratricopeptide repeat protein [candidate division WOR-3 bacterium]
MSELSIANTKRKKIIPVLCNMNFEDFQRKAPGALIGQLGNKAPISISSGGVSQEVVDRIINALPKDNLLCNIKNIRNLLFFLLVIAAILIVNRSFERRVKMPSNGFDRSQDNERDKEMIPKISDRKRERTEEKSPMSYYSAKQAFARLILYLRENKQPLPQVIWNGIPERTSIYSHGESGLLSGIVGGWLFCYEDINGNTWIARLTCLGEVVIEKEETDFNKFYPRPIKLDEWILDNTDAHIAVLREGGEGRVNNFGGWLMTVVVKDRGARPVWGGGAWYMPDKGLPIMVDAQTGELYDEEKAEPITLSKTYKTEWDGGFDEKSPDALISKSEYYYWWPRAYRNFNGYYIYNRLLLLTKLEEEKSKLSRSASSWMTTGILHGILGNWEKAVDDLNKAIQMEPQNSDYRYYRGLTFLIIRDLDKATSDFLSLPQDSKARTDALRYVETLRGKKESEGIIAFAQNIITDIGMIPLEVHLGPIPLASIIPKRQ